MDSKRAFGVRQPALTAGFTLIELMVAVLVAGILLSIGVPAFHNFVMNDRDIGQANSLVSSFNYARTEAVKRNAGGVTVCASINGTTCGGAWTDGWIVIDAAANVLQAVPAQTVVNTLTATSPAGVTFLSSGLVSAPLTIRICDTRGAAYARDVEVNAAGRVAASSTPGLSVAGVALVCP